MEELRQLGRYQLTRVLGRGAMGVVYEGTDPKLNRQVAVKTILKGHISDPELEAEYSARFIREAQAVARLNHPNIVTVFDFGEENEIAFIVMECIRGDELKTYFDEKRQFSLEDAVRMTGELLDALDYAHENGIVHRDIKPANVMLDGQSRVKLTDFGVARLSDASAERTQAGTMVGTPSYMSPEQIEGSAVGPRSDIFAVGIILYQFLTGEKPFHATGLWAIQKKIMQDDPVLPSVLNSSLPPAFDAVILRALAKKPDDRYATARDFKKDLQRALAGQELEDTDSTRLVSSTRPKTSSNAITPAAESSQASRSGSSSTAATRANPVSEATGTAGLEIEFWRSIKDSTDAEDIIAYMKRFPNGVYSELAQRKLAKLRGETTSSTASLQPPFAQNDDATRLHTTGITGIGGITPDDDDGATRMVPQGGRGQASGGTHAGNANNTQAPAPNAAPPATGGGKNKLLLPGVAAGVLAVAGLAFMLTGKDKPAPVASVPTEVAANTTTPAATPTPTPPVVDDSAKQAAAEQAAKLEAEKKEAEKKEAERKEAERLAQEKRDTAKTPEDKKKLELEAKKKAEELAKKQEEDAAKKKAELEAKKLKEEETKKARDELAKKKLEDETKKKLEDEAKKKALDEAKAKEAQAATAAANQVAVAKPATSPAGLRSEAAALEGQGKMRDAVKLYKQAALAGDGEAAKRLGNIYGKGEGGIARDYAESLKWNGIARKLGIDIPVGDKM